MAPFPVANSTLISAILQHSLINTSALLQSSLLHARTATPVGPSTQTSTSVEGVPATFSGGSTYANSPRTYIGIGPAIVTNIPALAYSNGSSSRASTHPRLGFIALVSLVPILFAIVGYLVWRRSRKRQSPARPPIRPRQKRSETARALAAGEDPPPSLASSLPRDIIRAMNAAPGPTIATGDETDGKHEYPPSSATPNKPSDPPYTYFSTALEISLPPLPTWEATSPNSSAPSSPGPTTPTFSPSSLAADDKATLDRFSWDFKCKGKLDSADSDSGMLSDDYDPILVEDVGRAGDTLSSNDRDTDDRQLSQEDIGCVEVITSTECEPSDSTCINVRGEVFVLVPSTSSPKANAGKELLGPGCPLSSNNCTRSDASSPLNTSSSTVSSALLSALGLDGFDSSTSQKASTNSSFPMPIADEPPRLEHIVAMDSFSFDIDFEPFHIQVVQSRPASSSTKEASHAHDETKQSMTDNLESKLQSVISTRRSASRSASTVLLYDDDDEEVNGSPKVRPVICSPIHRSESPTTANLKLMSSASSSSVVTPRLDLVAETQIHSEEYTFPECPVVLPEITLTDVTNTSYLRSCDRLPGAVSSGGEDSIRSHSSRNPVSYSSSF